MLAEALKLCRRPEFLTAISRILMQADRDISLLAPVCFAGGACCKFDLTGERLMVSTGELALLLRQPPPRPRQAALQRCPYQSGPLCTARQRRPLGCRTFFCRGGLGEPAAAVYERHHASLRALHDASAIPYVYVELTGAILQLIGGTNF
jgi:Fe-S-cluster containining protein